MHAVLETLVAEHQALQARDADALLAASSAKSAAVAEAARLGQQRRELQVADAVHAGAGHLVAELKRVAAECRQRNEANGLLIRGQRRRVEASLQLLTGTAAAAGTYGRDGESLPIRASRLPLATF